MNRQDAKDAKRRREKKKEISYFNPRTSFSLCFTFLSSSLGVLGVLAVPS
jgi:hypothetical protein